MINYALDAKTTNFRNIGEKEHLFYDLFFSEIRNWLGGNLRIAISSTSQIYQNRLGRWLPIFKKHINLFVFFLKYFLKPVNHLRFRTIKNNIGDPDYSNIWIN